MFRFKFPRAKHYLVKTVCQTGQTFLCKVNCSTTSWWYMVHTIVAGALWTLAWVLRALGMGKTCQPKDSNVLALEITLNFSWPSDSLYCNTPAISAPWFQLSVTFLLLLATQILVSWNHCCCFCFLSGHVFFMCVWFQYTSRPFPTPLKFMI
jgi:hypothetical protein